MESISRTVWSTELYMTLDTDGPTMLIATCMMKLELSKVVEPTYTHLFFLDDCVQTDICDAKPSRAETGGQTDGTQTYQTLMG